MAIARAFLMSLVVCSAAIAEDWSTDIALVKDMVVLDKAYIPALLSTRNKDVSRSRESIGQLSESWVTFQLKWHDVVNAEWQSGFRKIDRLIAEVHTLDQEELDLDEAYQKLDAIRHTFAALRLERSIEYFVDFVTATEIALDEVARTAADTKSDSLSSEEVDVVRQQLRIAQDNWKIVAHTRIDKIIYRIDIYYMGDVASTRAEGLVLFEDVIRSVDQLNRTALIEKVTQISKKVEHFLEILGATPGS